MSGSAKISSPSRFAIGPGQWRFAICTTVASILAMGISMALGIGSPWWAAMAVWMVARPIRGLLLERALFQLLGTIAGGLAVAAILHVAHSPLVDIILLSPVLALSAALSTLWRHTRSYGAALCGVTVTVVVVLGSGFSDPDAIAVARVLDQCIGILCSCVVIGALHPPGPDRVLIERLKAAAAEAIDVAIATLQDPALSSARRNALLVELAQAEIIAEDGAAGSFRLRRQLHGVFGLLGAILSLLTTVEMLRKRIGGTAVTAIVVPDLVATLEKARVGLARSETGQADGLDFAILHRRLDHPDVRPDAAVAQMVEALMANHRVLLAEPVRPQTGWLHHHQDRRGALRAALRMLIAVFLTGGIWVATGWEDIQFILLVCGVFLSLFGTMDTAASIVRRAFFGAVTGLALAAVWRLALDAFLPPGLMWTLLGVSPVLLVGSAFYVQRKWAFFGLATNMIFLLIAQPPLRAPAGSLGFTSLFLVLGIAAAELFFRWPLQASPERRKASLLAAVEREVTKLRSGPSMAEARHRRARLRHLVLLIIGQDGGSATAAETGFVALLRAEAPITPRRLTYNAGQD